MATKPTYATVAVVEEGIGSHMNKVVVYSLKSCCGFLHIEQKAKVCWHKDRIKLSKPV